MPPTSATAAVNSVNAPAGVAARSTQFVPALNGLRGIAVSAVVIFHASEAALPGGFLGVDLFFVLSGFLITWLLATEYDQRGRISYVNFYARRLLRLAPALLALLAVFVTASFVLRSRVSLFVSDVQDAGIALMYLSNWAVAFDLHAPNYIRHTWSLSIEEQFYMLWPVSLAAGLRASKSRIALAGACLALTVAVASYRALLMANGVSAQRLYNGLDTRADALLVGATLVLLLRAASPQRVTRIAGSKQFAAVVILAAALLGSALATAYSSDPALYRWKLLAVEVLAAVLVTDAVISARSPVKRLLEFAPLVWVGTVSYGLYLWHYPIFRLLRDADFHGWALFAAGTAASLVVTALSYYVMERPILKLKKRFERVARTRPARATAMPAE